MKAATTTEISTLSLHDALPIFGVATAGRYGKLFDVAVHDDALDLGKTAAGGRQSGIAPRQNHLPGTLCYNEIARRLRDDRNGWFWIAAFATEEGSDEQQRQKKPRLMIA